MAGTLYAVSMPKFLRYYKLLFKTFLYKYIKPLCMLIFERHRIWFSSRLLCLQSFDYDISPILQEIISLKMRCTT